MHRILFHKDSDGHAAGVVVYRWLLEQEIGEEEIAWHPINYGMPIPPEIDYENDRVYMVDFSLQPTKIMVDFTSSLGSSLVWIDHHKTSIDMEEKSDTIRLARGLRCVEWDGTPISGCELTWRYFYPDTKIPFVLELVGDWDTWRWKNLNVRRQLDVQSFQYFLKSFPSSPNVDSAREWWLQFLKGGETYVLQNYCDEGCKLLDYQRKQWLGLMAEKSFEADFQGLRAIMINQGGNSQMFDGFFNPGKHDVMVTFQLVKGKYLTVSLYTTETDRVHLGELAKKLGGAGDIPSGGGHAGAAGFQCGWEYFSSLYTIGE